MASGAQGEGWRGKVDETIDFWYGRPWKDLAEKDPLPEAIKRWYEGGQKLDDEIKNRFEESVLAAAAEMPEEDGKVSIPAGLEEELKAHPDRAAVLIAFFDQFTRNIFRGRTQMFAYDRHALALCRLIFDDGSYRQMPPIVQTAIGTVFMHSEDPEMSQRSIIVGKGVLEDPTATEMAKGQAKATIEYGESHYAVVKRFGRFPHRNEFLGRETTAEEAEFLRTEAPKHPWMKIMKKED